MKTIINEEENEENKNYYALSTLKNGKSGLAIKGVSDGKNVTFYIFKHTNNKYYFLCPECIVKPSNLEDGAKDYSDIKDENAKSTLYKLINAHSYFIKIERIQSSSKYKDEPIINKKSKLKLDLSVNDNNKKIYAEIPTYLEKIESYEEMSVNSIKSVPNEIHIIKSCIKNESNGEIDYKNIDAYVIHRETPSKERFEILNNKEIEQFYYETDDNDRYIIQKNGKYLYCILNDEDTRLCAFDESGFLKVLFK